MKKPKKVLYRGDQKEYNISEVMKIIDWILFQKVGDCYAIKITPDTIKIHSPDTLLILKAKGYIDDNFKNEVTMGFNIEVQIDSNFGLHNYTMLLRKGKKNLFFAQSNYDNLIKHINKYPPVLP